MQATAKSDFSGLKALLLKKIFFLEANPDLLKTMFPDGLIDMKFARVWLLLHIFSRFDSKTKIKGLNHEQMFKIFLKSSKKGLLPFSDQFMRKQNNKKIYLRSFPVLTLATLYSVILEQSYWSSKEVFFYIWS